MGKTFNKNSKMKTFDKGDSEDYTGPVLIRELIYNNDWDEKKDRICKDTALRIVR